MIYGGGHFKIITSEIIYFWRRTSLGVHLRKSILGGGHTIKAAFEKRQKAVTP